MVGLREGEKEELLARDSDALDGVELSVAKNFDVAAGGNTEDEDGVEATTMALATHEGFSRKRRRGWALASVQPFVVTAASVAESGHELASGKAKTLLARDKLRDGNGVVLFLAGLGLFHGQGFLGKR